MDGVVVLSNPNSGRNFRDKSRFKTIQKIVGNRGIVYSTKNPDCLEKILSDLPKHDPKALIISGGDGTVSTVVTKLMRYWPGEKELPVLGVIPSGTINILAKEYTSNKKTPLRPFRYFKNLFNDADQLDYLRGMVSLPEERLFYKDVDFMKVSDNNGLCTYGFSAGAGLIVDLLHEYYKAKHLKLIKMSSMAVHLMWSALFNGKYYQSLNKKHSFSVNGDEPEDYLWIVSQTLQSVGTPKSSPFYKAQLCSGKFHTMGAKFNLDKFIRYFPAFYSGDEIPGMLDIQTDSIVLSSEQEFAYQVNGDLDYLGKPFKACILKMEHGITCKIVQPRN